ncbi:hypothetical protein GCM10017044_18010 [Kordiimonas sediminis]|uniref:DUF1905 domain-containing protein n=1 Tax=Kordiimonas sediminis TaxID=1735581 RepID=A0A919E883_9PROT|nr:DUF1905 domain-containing protein [Kordiimonas sediminis]GHF23836.1 hypothetical protein GCM10017044_18010 [Kordiimonas sediminis]
MHELSYTITEDLWIYPAKAAWHFVTVPEDISAEIKFFTSGQRRGWNSVRVDVQVGDTQWQTSIFRSAKDATYLLPVKAEVRKREKLTAGDKVTVDIRVIET